MRVLLPLLIACGPSTEEPAPELRVAFDTEIPTVARVEADGALADLQFTSDPPAPGAYVTGDRIVGLPAGANLTVEGTVGGASAEPATGTVPDPGLPAFEVLRAEPEAWMSDGFLVAAVLSEERSGIAVYDGSGTPVWGWRAPDTEVSASPVVARSGTDLLAFFSHRDRDLDQAVIRRLPLDGSPGTETPATAGHHSFVELPDGHLVWMSRNFPTVQGPDATDWTLLNDTLRIGPEGDPGGGEVLFDLLEHQPFYRACDHVDTLHDRYGEVGVHDWSHANSLVLDEQSGLLLYGIRLHDSLLALDPATGEVAWQAGGVDPDLVPTDPWAHAHFTWATADRALVFDNHTHGDPLVSRAVELAFDHQAGTAEVVWSFDQPDGGFTAWLGDVRPLPDGHRLIAFTEVGRVLEVAPDGRVLWEAKTSDGSFVGRIRYTERLDALEPG